MMKKLLIITFAFILSSAICWAQVPSPTYSISQQSCNNDNGGALTITSPLSNISVMPTEINLFISEVTDKTFGSLTYIEIYNGTGNTLDLSNYKLVTINNGNVAFSCQMNLFGLISNFSSKVIRLSSDSDSQGITPDFTFPLCPGINNNDNIRLMTTSDVLIDIWGTSDGTIFTPTNSGYTYRRKPDSVRPSSIWNPSDWVALPIEDYTNVGSYTASLIYEYSLDNGPWQTSTNFTNVSAGTHSLIARELPSGTQSIPVNFLIQSLSLTATINYSASPYCKSITAPQSVTISGTGAYTGGTFSAPSELSINPNTGEINPSLSNAGTYTVTYTTPLAGGCLPISTTTQVTITTPQSSTINYSSSSFCRTLSSIQTVTLIGTGAYAGGTFTAISGLSINPNTGAINPSLSSAGTYSVTYTTPTVGGCSVSTSTQVTITALPAATINYSGSPYCRTESTPQSVTLSGTGAYTGGTFTATSGLSINPNTGAINPSLSTAGNYTVTYTTPASGGCSITTTSTQIVILGIPNASIFADAVQTNSVSINNGNSVQLQLFASLSNQPNIQWIPAISINSASIINPVVYPNTTTTYTATFINSNGCNQSTSITVNVNQIPNIGNLSITSSSNSTFGLFETISIDVQLNDASNLYSLFMKLKGNPVVSQYLDYDSFTAGSLLGTGGNVISTPPTVTNGVPDFGITKVGAAGGFNGSGLFYTLRFKAKNISIPNGTVFCFYLDDVNAYNSTGTQCGLSNQGQLCFTFTNQVDVWPGDLNKSNTVTTADILPIGYFYNSTGPTRPNASIQWTAQPATLWGYNRSSTNGDGFKVFADSNGDGVINNADQAAVGFNMGRIHNRLSNSHTGSDSRQNRLSVLSAGNLTITPSTSLINAATLPQTVSFTVGLNNTGGLGGLYGISVNLMFDATIFDLNTATVDYAGSIFGNAGSDCLVLNYASNSMLSVGMTRFANVPIVGQGLLFKVTLQTKTILPSLIQTQVTSLVEAANNQAGVALIIQEASPISLDIINNNLGIQNLESGIFELYPNPVKDIFIVNSSAKIQQVTVFNNLGQMVLSRKENSYQASFDLSGLPAGNYFVKIESGQKRDVIKIIKE